MKKLAELKLSAHFMYGGVEWVKFEDIGAGTLCLAAEPVFRRVFDEENCNDWRKSSLRRELNGVFLDALVAEGADRAAFLDWESDLTADDGMTDYGTAVDKIALRSDALCRKYREITPPVDAWCWNLTPWTCDHEYSCSVRSVRSSGALYYSDAYSGYSGVRPLCYLKSEISVSIPREDDEEEQAARREEMKLEAARLMGYKLIKEEGESKMENYIVINGKKAELTPEQLEKLGIVVSEEPSIVVSEEPSFERKHGEHYYCIQQTRGGVFEATDTGDDIDLERYSIANYCRDRKLMEQRALHETLSRLLWRYSLLHNRDNIDWKNFNTRKWYIVFDHNTGKFLPTNFNCFHVEGTVFFYNYETAKTAITEIIEPFMKDHPDFVW